MKKNVMYLVVVTLVSSCVGALTSQESAQASPLMVQPDSTPRIIVDPMENFVGVSSSGSVSSSAGVFPKIDPIAAAQATLNNAFIAQKNANLNVQNLKVAADSANVAVMNQPKMLAVAQASFDAAKNVWAKAAADAETARINTANANAALGRIPSLGNAKSFAANVDKKLSMAQTAATAADARVKAAQAKLDSVQPMTGSSGVMLSGQNNLSTTMTTTPR